MLMLLSMVNTFKIAGSAPNDIFFQERISKIDGAGLVEYLRNRATGAEVTAIRDVRPFQNRVPASNPDIVADDDFLIRIQKDPIRIKHHMGIRIHNDVLKRPHVFIADDDGFVYQERIVPVT